MEQQALMLKGYHVLDFTHYGAGPTCTRILAELGADVIKVERSLEGDHVRELGAKELLLKMIRKIDVVVENFAPGVIAQMGFGYEALREINPKLVMCSVSATEQTGPLSNRPGYDFIGASYAGVTDLLGEPDRPPIVPAMAIGDVSTGVNAAMAVGFALLNAARTGKGQCIDASLLDTYFHMHELCVPVMSLRKGQFTQKRTGSQHQTGSPAGVYKCNNDGYIMLLVQQHEFPRLARAMGMPELVTDERFKTNNRRVRNNDALKELIENGLATFPDRDSAVAALDKERVPCGPVLSLEEAMEHPHLRERKTIRRVKDPRLGEFDMPSMPVRFSDWQYETDLKASLLGEDNEAVLHEMLGLSDNEIAELYSKRVLLKVQPASDSGSARNPS